MAYVGLPADCASPRIAILGRNGDILIVQSEHVHEMSAGYLAVVADITSEAMQTTQCTSDGHVPNSTTHNLQRLKVAGSFSLPAYVTRSYPDKIAGKHLLASALDHLVVVGTDGAARLFKVSGMIGSNMSSLCNKRLTAFDPNKSNPTKRKASIKALVTLDTDLHTLRKGSKSDVTTMHRQGCEGRQVKPETTKSQSPDSLYEFFLHNDDNLSENRNRNRNTSRASAMKHLAANKYAAKGKKQQQSASAAAGATRKTVQHVVKTPIHSFISGQHYHNTATVAGVDVKNMPLFELASLTPIERRVNYTKLKAFLDKHGTLLQSMPQVFIPGLTMYLVIGEYPSRYRPLIWRFLLKLPENSVAFADLGKCLQ
jgi:hypothetical protein